MELGYDRAVKAAGLEHVPKPVCTGVPEHALAPAFNQPPCAWYGQRAPTAGSHRMSLFRFCQVGSATFHLVYANLGMAYDNGTFVGRYDRDKPKMHPVVEGCRPTGQEGRIMGFD